MSGSGQTICLNMIVKNEAPVIRRCLDSVFPLIDHWIIVDTGSTDGTQEIIRNRLRDVPGELFERPWQDFGTNRTEALALAHGKCDYTLIIDADDTLVLPQSRALPALNADAYAVEVIDGGMIDRRPQLIRSGLPWRYEGVVHEHLACDIAGPASDLPAFRMQRHNDGARRRDPDVFQRDAELLEAALKTEANPSLAARYRFYLAQSYRDGEVWEKALKNYQVRAGLGFSDDEVYISLFRAAQMMEKIGHLDQEIITAYLRAAAFKPARVEALHGASRFCRQRSRYEEGFQIAERGIGIPMPVDGLFVEPWIYEVGLLDEYAGNAYRAGRYRESLIANLDILGTGKLTGKNIQRTVANARHASEKLGAEPPPKPGGKGNAGLPNHPKPQGRQQPNDDITRKIEAHPQFAAWSQGSGDGPVMGIVIPYRHREEHLKRLVPHLISFFRRDRGHNQIRPLIVVSEQADDLKFNRGWCRNAGFSAVEKYCDYVCFHDVDYLPMWADYSYTAHPTRIIWWGMNLRPVRPATDNRWHVTISKENLGAVYVIDNQQFRAANGYSNNYHGWGYEDVDLKIRLEALGIAMKAKDGTFVPLDHDHDGFAENGELNEDGLRNEKLALSLQERYLKAREFSDGLSSMTWADLDVNFERWTGLDEREKMIICRLRMKQVSD